MMMLLRARAEQLENLCFTGVGNGTNSTSSSVFLKWHYLVLHGAHSNENRLIKICGYDFAMVHSLANADRTVKTPNTYDEKPAVLVSKGEQHGLVVNGFCESIRCVTIFDGTSDMFESLPPTIKKKFQNTSGIRTFMGVDANESCKVFAIVMDNYKSKGVHQYELKVGGRVRSGYAKCEVNEIQRVALTKEKMNSFFGSSSNQLREETPMDPRLHDVGGMNDDNHARPIQGPTEPTCLPDTVHSVRSEKLDGGDNVDNDGSVGDDCNVQCQNEYHEHGSTKGATTTPHNDDYVHQPHRADDNGIGDDGTRINPDPVTMPEPPSEPESKHLRSIILF